MPAFVQLIADDKRQVVYGTDIGDGLLYFLSLKDGSPIGQLMLGADQSSQPAGMDMSPDGSRLAVALSGAGQIAIVDLNSRTVVQRISFPGYTSSPGTPKDVRYGRPGRLYAVGDWLLHVIDTTTGQQVAATTKPIPVYAPRLSISGDKRFLYMMEGNGDPTQLVRWDVSTDSPVETDATQNAPAGFQAVVRPDGSQVYTTGGQVWSGSLDHQVGNFTRAASGGSQGSSLTYAPATDRLFVGCSCYDVQEIAAGGFPYSVIGDRQLHGIATAMTTNAAGTMLYVSSSTPWTGSPPATFLETFDLTTPPASRYRPAASVPALFDSLVFDPNRNVLYGSDRSGGWVDVLSSTDGHWITAIDVGHYNEPVAMDISPDGSHLAVALVDAAQVAEVDLDSRTVSGHFYPLGTGGYDEPYDVRYGRYGRVYSTGTGCSLGFDYVHAFDTVTHAEVGRSQAIIRCAPRLAISPDRTSLYSIESGETPQTLARFDASTDALTETASNAYATTAVAGYEIAVRSDGSQVFTSGGNTAQSTGQAWSADLSTLLGTLADHGPFMAYSAAAGRVFIGNGHGVSEFLDSGPYTLVHTWSGPFSTAGGQAGPTTGPVAVSADGLTLYLSTDQGVTVIPRGQPMPPTNVVAKAGDGQATVSWTPPAITGSSPITSYVIQEWRFIEPPITMPFNSTATSQVITGLINGRAYQFQVTACNSQGCGDQSANSNVVVPGHPPGAPTNVTATAGNAQATVNWNAPADTGGAPITGYRVTSYINGVAQQSYELPWTSGSPPSMTITGLTNGQTYTFTVEAENDVGNSPDSAPSNPVTPHA